MQNFYASLLGGVLQDIPLQSLSLQFEGRGLVPLFEFASSSSFALIWPTLHDGVEDSRIWKIIGRSSQSYGWQMFVRLNLVLARKVAFLLESAYGDVRICSVNLTPRRLHLVTAFAIIELQLVLKIYPICLFKQML